MDKRRDEGHGNLSCSFCGKNQKEVKKLIAGPTVRSDGGSAPGPREATL